MKKLILNTSLLLTTMLSTCALAAEPVCSSSERTWATDSRFFDLNVNSVDGATVAHFFDSETIKIDKKKKIIKVWIIQEKSEKGRSDMSKKFNGFSSYGYEKGLSTFDYTNMRSKTSPVSFINCDGSIITTVTDPLAAWEEIFPSSITEAVVKKIMQKYNLK